MIDWSAIKSLWTRPEAKATVPALQLTQGQQDTRRRIEAVAAMFGIDPRWAVAVAMTESSLGVNQLSKTGCRGVFQMSTIAMKDLLQEMEQADDDLIDIVCGVAFLRVLLRRWHSIDGATLHYCDPQDRDFYLARVRQYMRQL